MSKKRMATTVMTHDNWDQEEDEPEEPGQIVTASSEKLAQRTIRVAKRGRVAPESDKPTGSLFGAFSGFGSKPSALPALAATSTPTTTASLFTPKPPIFGANVPSATSATFSFGLSSTVSNSTPMTRLPEFGLEPPKTTAPPTTTTSGGFQPSKSSFGTSLMIDATKPKTNTSPPKGLSSEYAAELTALNENVIVWMQENFQENPIVDFTPVFNDYKDHFKELETKYKTTSSKPKQGNVEKEKESVGAAANSGNRFGFNGSPYLSTLPSIITPAGEKSNTTTLPSIPSTTSSIFNPPVPTFPSVPPVPFSSSISKPPQPTLPVPTFSQPSSGGGFSFGLKSAASTKDSTPALSFGSAGMSSGATFSFGMKPAEKDVADGEDNDGGGEDGEYEPPKPERVEQTEDDAFYQVRCKLFYKKDDKFAEKGVGTLFLKPLDGGQKTQLLIRADTTSGKVLLNLSLNESIPCSRNGKNNVTMVCIPHPPLDPKSPSKEPVVLLIRVKTGEEADKLLEEINKGKSAS